MPDAISVLIVDDDPLALRLLERHLADSRFSVRSASNGVEALKIIGSEGPSIVITDWLMPEMDGLDLCRAIRTQEGISFTYVMVISGQTERDSVVCAFDAGADDYLPKPFTKIELIARLRAAERIVRLQSDLVHEQRLVYRTNAEIAVTHAKLTKANAKLHTMATVDELTGLTNRREAMGQLDNFWAQSLENDSPFSCVLFDIDRFKNINDIYGHRAGDDILRTTAEAMRESALETEVACRVGGEEFLLLCPGATEEQAAQSGERLRKAVEALLYRAGDAEIRVTISGGIASRTARCDRPDDMVKAADRAMYAAKDGGRNQICRVGQMTEDAETVMNDDSSIRKTTSLPTNEANATEDCTILVVDDEPASRLLCRRLLEREGYRIVEACNGVEALAEIEREPPDVVLMDSMMPEMDGLECTRRIRDNPERCTLPVVIASGRTDATDITTGIAAGADEYITKPFNPQELTLRVRTMVQMGRKLRESNDVRGEQTRALGLLLDYSQQIAAAATLEAVLQATIEAVAELVCCNRVSLLLPDAESHVLRVARCIDLDETTAQEIEVSYGVGIAGTVFESGNPVVVNDRDPQQETSQRYRSQYFVSAPLVSEALCDSEHVVGVLNITERILDQPFAPWELEYITMLSNVAASAIQDRLSRQAIDTARDSIVFALAKLAEHRDSDTGRHVDRVSRFSVMLAKQLQSEDRYGDAITDAFLDNLARSSPLHDIGKVGIPDRILCKPCKLTQCEMEIMRTHAEIGARTIESVIEHSPDAGFLTMAMHIARSHHEWFNGQGYPQGLTGQSVPLAARILAVADVYDALTTKRVYKDAIDHDEACSIIKDAAAKQFDPLIVLAFETLEKDFKRLAEELGDDDESDTGLKHPDDAQTVERLLCHSGARG